MKNIKKKSFLFSMNSVGIKSVFLIPNTISGCMTQF